MMELVFLFRDVLNHVYFDKRSLFLAGLRKTLEKANKKNGEKYKAFSFEYLKGDVRKPVLSIVPSFSSSVVVRLIPVVRFTRSSSLELFLDAYFEHYLCFPFF